MNWSRPASLVTSLGLQIACSPAPSPAPPPSPVSVTATAPLQAPPSLVAILTDSVLWGRDFPQVISALPAFSRQGDSIVVVSPSRVVGGRSFASNAAASTAAAELTRAVAARPGIARANVAGLIETARTGRAPLQAAPQADLEASTIRVGWANPSLRFVNPRLSIAMVRARLGPEERVTRVVLDSGTERRPVVLTLHHYANDAILFAESDWAATPGTIDRVILDAPRLTTALYQEGR